MLGSQSFGENHPQLVAMRNDAQELYEDFSPVAALLNSIMNCSQPDLTGLPGEEK